MEYNYVPRFSASGYFHSLPGPVQPVPSRSPLCYAAVTRGWRATRSRNVRIRKDARVRKDATHRMRNPRL